jgi:DNA (cytosine-5)-methyltransferase 1
LSKTVVDLFAGAGGFSLGAQWAGFETVAAIEVDRWACDTLEANHPGVKVVCADVTELHDDWLARELPRNPTLIIGGPPCQGFSHAAVGRQDPKDPRNSLFREFVRVVRSREPEYVILENVPGLLRARTATGQPVPDVIREEFEALGYEVAVLKLDATRFGVPQIRQRVMFIACASGAPVKQIVPSHGDQPSMLDDLRPLRTVRDAISDLPVVEVGRSEPTIEYVGPPSNEYQEFMRKDAPQFLENHIPMRHSQRMIERFKLIKPGESQSHVPEEHAPSRRVRTEEQGAGRYDQNNRRMFWDRPCHTIAATFYANFVHPEQHRNFTPREGARIQSFPDWYVFKGKPTVVSSKLLAREGRIGEKHLCQYVQIGNAVPPLLAAAVIEQATATPQYGLDESKE